MRCLDCGWIVEQILQKAVGSGEWQPMWTSHREWTWVCWATGNEHRPTGDPLWFVVVDRQTYEGEILPSYVVGPYASEAEADEELQSDSGIVFCLLTVDAKTERYVAGGDCYSTTEPPDDGQHIKPPSEANAEGE